MVAELEYLVRLANQRLLTEDRPQGALTLLVAADQLLKSMDSADTLAVREVLAKDISALKLVQPVDREGIYSRLGALIPAMLALPAVPSVGLGELTDDPETGSKPPGTALKRRQAKLSTRRGTSASGAMPNRQCRTLSVTTFTSVIAIFPLSPDFRRAGTVAQA